MFTNIFIWTMNKYISCMCYGNIFMYIVDIAYICDCTSSFHHSGVPWNCWTKSQAILLTFHNVHVTVIQIRPTIRVNWWLVGHTHPSVSYNTMKWRSIYGHGYIVDIVRESLNFCFIWNHETLKNFSSIQLYLHQKFSLSWVGPNQS